MPELGEIRRPCDLNLVGEQKRMWCACKTCGRERWVALIAGKPVYQHCLRCARPRGDKNTNWKGGRHIELGYVFVRIQPDNPYYCMANDGELQEHRYVMAQHLGRPLQRWELVDHRNGIRDDNRIENLDLVTHHENLQLQKMREELKCLEYENKNLSLRVTQLEAEVELLGVQITSNSRS